MGDTGREARTAPARFGSFGIESTGGRDALVERVKQASRRSIPLLTRTLGAEIERRLRAAQP